MSTRTPAASGSEAVSEATLFQQAQAGCRDSLDILMARHEGLVHAVVRRQVLGALSFAEALQAGRIGLWRAILGFDPARGFAFSTYAWPAIQRRVWRAIKSKTRLHKASELAGYASLPLFIYDFVLERLIDGEGLGYLTSHWYLTIAYVYVWIELPPCRLWIGGSTTSSRPGLWGCSPRSSSGRRWRR